MDRHKKVVIVVLVLLFILGSIVIASRNSKVRNLYAIISKDGHFVQNSINYIDQRNKRKAVERKIKKQTEELTILRTEERKTVNSDANAESYLNTPTYDSTGQGNHPDVVYFKEKFNGYKYWMAFTPYANSEDSVENPSILASNDGIKWEVPPKLKNPIVNPPDDVNEGGHYSDTDMIYVNNKLVVYFVYNKVGVHGGSKLYKVESQDGVNWSPKELVLQTPKKEDGYSPSLVYNKSSYKMWYFGGENKFLYTTSDDGKKWSDALPIKISIDGWKSWHAKVIETDLGYEALICYRKDNSNTRALFHAKSSNGTDWSVNSTPVIYPSAGKWDTGGIYRSAFNKRDGLYKVWYSAYDLFNKWHIGYSEGTSIERLKGMK